MPKKTNIVQFYLPAELYKEAERITTINGMTVNAWNKHIMSTILSSMLLQRINNYDSSDKS